MDYFKESITSDFTGTLCESWKKFMNGKCDGNAKLNMGIALNSSVIVDTGSIAYGKYYMNVNENSPYYTGSRNSAPSADRDGTPSITSMLELMGAKQACNVAKLLKKATFGLYDVTQTEWYHDLVATEWQNYS